MSKPKVPTIGAVQKPHNELNCNLCGATAWMGPLCSTCPAQGKEHYSEGMGSRQADYFCVAESPYLAGPSGTVNSHAAWNQDVEKLIKNAFIQQKKLEPAWAKLEGRFTSAVRCAVDKPNKKMKTACRPLFQEEFLSLSRPGKPIMIFALGPTVLQALGIKIGKYADAQGKFHNVTIEDRSVVVFASLSKRQLPAKTGYIDVLRSHINIFMGAVESSATMTCFTQINPALPLEKLIKDYRFPKSLKAVRELIEEIVLYSSPGKNPDNHSIAIDTETNTLHPHRAKLKILTFIVSWDTGKSASIPIEHPQTPWTFDEVFPYIQQLLSCPKPKIFHNAKYDLRVLQAKGWTVHRLAWDTMIAEHLLAEDKRGFYGLKPLTKTFLPAYSGYEDALSEIRYKAEKKAKKGIKKTAIVLTGAAKKLAEDDGFVGIPLKQLNEYGAVDADVTRQICGLQLVRIQKENVALAAVRDRWSKVKVYRGVSAPGSTLASPLKHIMSSRTLKVTKTLAAMEAYGMAVDREYIDELALKMDDAIVDSVSELTLMIPPKVFATPFNPNSPAHLQKLFFTTGYHPNLDSNDTISYKGVIPEHALRLTDTGQISTDAAFLKMLKAQYSCKFATALLEYRAISKARNTFIENIRVLSREDGRMHTTFNIMGTSTGRLSSSNENMQNVPGRIRQHNIKKVFVPSDRLTQAIVNADAKAAEVRLYAAYSRDKNLIDALCNGMDPHSFFSSVVLKPETVLAGIPKAQQNMLLHTIGIDDQHDWSYEDFQNRGAIKDTDPWYGKQLGILRSNIKRVVFGILYGASKNKIAAIVGISKDQAQAIINVLFRMFPTIPAYIKQTKSQVEIIGTVETFIGRRRRFDTRGMTNYMKSKAERQAVNFKIQSTSSDIVMDVLCSIDAAIRELDGHQLITVHDSLVLEIPKKYVSQIPDLIEEYGVKRVAKNYPWLPVPFSWDVEAGPSYGELQPIEHYLADNPLDVSGDGDYEEHEILNELASI